MARVHGHDSQGPVTPFRPDGTVGQANDCFPDSIGHEHIFADLVPLIVAPAGPFQEGNLEMGTIYLLSTKIS